MINWSSGICVISQNTTLSHRLIRAPKSSLVFPLQNVGSVGSIEEIPSTTMPWYVTTDRELQDTLK